MEPGNEIKIDFVLIKSMYRRTSTIILIRQDQSGLFIEKTLADPSNDPGTWNKQMWKFQLNEISEPPSRLDQ